VDVSDGGSSLLVLFDAGAVLIAPAVPSERTTHIGTNFLLIFGE
jgi:hypothetical protein